MKTKAVHFEVLRIIAIFFVVFQHTGEYGAQLYYSLEPTSISYWLSMFTYMFGKIAVPIFFMISGALLLKKDEPLSVILKKRVLRIFLVLLIVSVGYYLIDNKENLSFALIPDFFKLFFTKGVQKNLWYLYSYIAALLMLPFLRILVKKLKDEHYKYLIVINILLTSVASIFSAFWLKKDIHPDLEIQFATFWNIFYMLMGYYLEYVVPKKNYTNKNAVKFLFLGIAVTGLCVLISHFYFSKNGYTDKNLIFSKKFMTLPALALYFFVKTLCQNKVPSERLSKFILFLGSNVFGIYLADSLLRRVFISLLDILPPVIGDLPACYLYVFVCVVTGFIVIGLLRLIPFVRKLI